MNTSSISKPLRGLLAAAILGTISVGFATVGAASNSTDVRSVTVNYGDLNLSNPEGAAALYHRILWAAHTVCDSEDSNFASRRAARACIDQAVADAVMKVDRPELIAVYDAKTHRALPITVASAR